MCRPAGSGAASDWLPPVSSLSIAALGNLGALGSLEDAAGKNWDIFSGYKADTLQAAAFFAACAKGIPHS